LSAIVHAQRSARAIARGAAKAQVLSSAVTLVSSKQRTRASFYRAEGSSPRRRLVRDGFQGRSGSPRALFEESDEIVGKAVFDMLDRHQTVFVRDNEPGPDGASLGKSYRTYIASTVAMGDDLIGMLCVDAPAPGI
jgi:putative methionine-R-sulfoxide reductase with GAF domain